MGIAFLPDRLGAGGGGSSDGEGAGVACGDDGGVTKLSSKSGGRVGVSGTSEVGGTSGTVENWGVGGVGSSEPQNTVDPGLLCVHSVISKP